MAVVTPQIVPVPALYVGDLHPDISDSTLFELFSRIGLVASVRVCRDFTSGRSLGYGYINYVNPDDASRAIGELNHTILNRRPIRIMWSHRDPNTRTNGIGNLFVKNLTDAIDNVRLHQLFGRFGAILSCKVVTDQDGKSKGYGFVQFESPESANAAIGMLNGSTIQGKQIYVGKFIRRSERVLSSPDVKYTNLYMKNLDHDITEELIELKFSEFGKINKVAIAKDADGNSKGFGFVSFESPDNAKGALEAMHGLQLGTKALYVARAQKKAERKELLRRLYEERKHKVSNVYVKNIDDAVDDNALREHFSQCGTITSAKIMLDNKGLSKGFGFVCFSSPEEASNAVNTLHGCMFHGKPLYVAIAQRKAERQAHLQLQFAQRVAGLTASSLTASTLAAGSPGAVIPSAYPPVYYPPSVVPQISPRQNLFYQPAGMRPGWRPNGFVPPSRPGFQPMPLFGIPNGPRHSRQNRGRVTYMAHQAGQPIQSVTHLQQQFNHSFNMPKDYSGQQRYGQVKYVPNSHPALNSQGTEILSTLLAAAAPQQQKEMLGERLYPLVMKHRLDLAGKITGMLLDLDNAELLLLLESPEVLAQKVQAAVDLLESSKTKPGGQDALQSNYLPAEVAAN